MISATYNNREGERWDLSDLMPDPHVRGMWWGVRTDTGALVHVHQHRLVFAEKNPPQAPPGPATPNPS